MATFLKTTEISVQGAHTLPGEFFTSPDIFREEMEKIFLRRWICVGREDRLPNPGDWFTQEIGKESVIVLRDKTGGFRAYFNVCRHRGTRICEEHTGRFSETIQCPYHAWTYGLDGRLIGAPSTNDLEGFDKADWPLHPVAVATWEGLPLHQPRAGRGAVRQGVELAHGAILPLQPAQPQGAPDHRVRREVELEAALPELLGVLPLRPGPSRARQAHPADQRRERPDRRSVHRGLHGDQPGPRESHDERQLVRRHGR